MDHSDAIQQVHELLTAHIPQKHKRTPAGWVTFSCPMCNDRRNRAGVIATGPKIAFNCFNCGLSTGWSPSKKIGKKYKDLVVKLGATTESVKKLVLELMKIEEFGDEADEVVVNYEKFKPVELPNAISLNDVPTLPYNKVHNDILEYAYSRGLLKTQYNFFVCDNLMMKNRLIIPYYYNQEMVGFTGRHISPPTKDTPKYINNSQAGYVFNIDKYVYSDRDIVVVTEGVLDAILIDGISPLGNTMNERQVQQINSLNKRVILCPDRDTPGKDLIKQAAELGWEVSFPPWDVDCKDVGDAVTRYGRLLTLSSIIKHAVSNEVKIKVQSKML